MQVAMRILTNTPVWVFPLLAYLIWQAQLRSSRPRGLSFRQQSRGLFHF
jgi:hypothetical protein